MLHIKTTIALGVLLLTAGCATRSPAVECSEAPPLPSAMTTRLSAAPLRLGIEPKGVPVDSGLVITYRSGKTTQELPSLRAETNQSSRAAANALWRQWHDEILSVSTAPTARAAHTETRLVTSASPRDGEADSYYVCVPGASRPRILAFVRSTDVSSGSSWLSIQLV
jgi:hypothetical protein